MDLSSSPPSSRVQRWTAGKLGRPATKGVGDGESSQPANIHSHTSEILGTGPSPTRKLMVSRLQEGGNNAEHCSSVLFDFLSQTPDAMTGGERLRVCAEVTRTRSVLCAPYSVSTNPHSLHFTLSSLAKLHLVSTIWHSRSIQSRRRAWLALRRSVKEPCISAPAPSAGRKRHFSNGVVVRGL